MVTKQNQFSFDSAINQVNNASNDQLNIFIDDYLSAHSYFKSKDIALKYLFETHQLTFYDLSTYSYVINNLTRKIGKLLKPYKLSGDIVPYNAKTYQVIKR